MPRPVRHLGEVVRSSARRGRQRRGEEVVPIGDARLGELPAEVAAVSRDATVVALRRLRSRDTVH